MLFTRKTTRRAGWAAVALGLLLSVIPILAGQASGAASGTFVSGGLGQTVQVVHNGTTKSTFAGILRVEINGATYRAFCLDFGTFPGGTYTETPWASSGVPNLPRIKRVVEAYQAGPSSAVRAAAAQVLIWRYTDSISLPADAPADLLAAYNAIDAAASGSGSEPAPSPTVDIGNGVTNGTAGSTFGPYVITTNKASVNLVSNNPAVVMKVNGAAATTAANGDQLTIEVPAGTPAGSAKVTASVAGKVGSGAVFTSPGKQPWMIIDDVPMTASDSITITWTVGSDQPPVATPSVDCDAKSVTISITNPATNTNPATVVVSDPGAGSQTVVLAPGETKVVTVPIGADGVYDITVTHDGKVLTTAKGTDDDCDTPKPPVVATPVVDCDAKSVTISITNPATNTNPATVVVSDPGAGSQTVVLAPGETKVVTVPIGADGVYDITVTHDGKVLTTAKGTDDDCDKPANLTAVHVLVCDAQSVTVTVSNDGGQAGTAVVADTAAGFSQSITVPAKGQVQVVVPVGADKAYDITVTSAGATVARFTGDVNSCPPPTTTTTTAPPPPPPPPVQLPAPQASVADACDAGGVLLSLRNDGAGTAVFTVRNDGVVVTSGVGVVRESPQTVLVPVSGQNYDIVVTATPSYEARFAGSKAICSVTTTTVQVAGTTVVPGGDDPDASTTTSATVLGTTVAPTPVGGGTLPHTGAASRTASGLGMALLVLGGCLLLLSGLARREQHPIRVLDR